MLPDGFLIFPYWAMYNIELLPQNKHFAKVGSTIWQRYNKPLSISQRFMKFCQSGEILPNLVTLKLAIIHLGLENIFDGLKPPNLNGSATQEQVKLQSWLLSLVVTCQWKAE